jgi:hypothetical protein
MTVSSRISDRRTATGAVRPESGSRSTGCSARYEKPDIVRDFAEGAGLDSEQLRNVSHHDLFQCCNSLTSSAVLVGLPLLAVGLDEDVHAVA